MFCYQCQETANLQDLLIYVVKGTAIYVDNFNIKPTGEVKADVEAMKAGK